MRFGRVAMRMIVDVIAMTVRVRVIGWGTWLECRDRPSRTHKGKNVYQAERHQHERNGKFHTQPESRWNRYTEQDDGRAHNKNRQRVADSPEDAGPCGAAYLILAAHDGGDRNDMIWVGGVSHSEKEADGEDGNEADHGVSSSHYAKLNKDCKCRGSDTAGLGQV